MLMIERTAARRRAHRRARVAVMSGAALFLLTQLGLGWVTTAWRPALRDPYYGQKVRLLQQRLADAPAPSTVVMVGSSRTAYGFAPARLEGRLAREIGRPVVAFNFGLFGAGPATELLTLRRLLDDGIRPSLLLVEVLPPLLAASSGRDCARGGIGPACCLLITSAYPYSIMCSPSYWAAPTVPAASPRRTARAGPPPHP